MSPRVPCRNCQCLILPQTAEACGGRCAVCYKRSQRKIVRETLKDFFLGLPKRMALLPFEIVRYLARRQIRRWRFPYDRKALYQAILRVHPQPAVAKSYLNGVIDGHQDQGKVMHVWGRDQARVQGHNDGTRLWRGEIMLDDIPLCRRDLGPPAALPKGVRYQHDGTGARDNRS